MRENINTYANTVKKLREFFNSKNYTEIETQSSQSILAACEDPFTLSTFKTGGIKFPLKQTGQVDLEYTLMNFPDLAGVYTSTTSFRDEPNPIPGRHDRIFPMQEFEAHGTYQTLLDLEKELVKFLGFSDPKEIEYEDVCKEYHTDIIESEHEEMLFKDLGPVIFLKRFPERTSPFWNMKKEGDLYNKCDVLLYGMETIGSAERDCDVDRMRKNFFTISKGKYAEKLFELFGKDRVVEELENFFQLKMIPRFGAGIGMTRLIRAMNLKKASTL